MVLYLSDVANLDHGISEPGEATRAFGVKGFEFPVSLLRLDECDGPSGPRPSSAARWEILWGNS
jgi:hypothetical protein